MWAHYNCIRRTPTQAIRVCILKPRMALCTIPWCSAAHYAQCTEQSESNNCSCSLIVSHNSKPPSFLFFAPLLVGWSLRFCWFLNSFPIQCKLRSVHYAELCRRSSFQILLAKCILQWRGWRGQLARCLACLALHIFYDVYRMPVGILWLYRAQNALAMQKKHKHEHTYSIWICCKRACGRLIYTFTTKNAQLAQQIYIETML